MMRDLGIMDVVADRRRTESKVMYVICGLHGGSALFESHGDIAQPQQRSIICV